MGLTYLDSSVVLDALVNPDPRGDAARIAIGSARDETLVISPLVDLECMVQPLRSGDHARIDAMRQTLLRFRQVAITSRAYRLGAHIRAVHGLKTADALHVAAASLADCSQLWTSDRRLLRALPDFAVDPGYAS